MGNVIQLFSFRNKPPKHPKCRMTYTPNTDDFDCGYKTTITCDECKYCRGRKDPEANCNREPK